MSKFIEGSGNAYLFVLVNQGKAVSIFLDAILNKKVQSTTGLTAARGRGKSAALGLGIAGAIAAGCVKHDGTTI